MPKFNEAKYREILEARERLTKMNVKNYGYPEPPEPTIEERLDKLEKAQRKPLSEFLTPKLRDAMKQLKSQAIYNDKQIKDMRIKIKKYFEDRDGDLH